MDLNLPILPLIIIDSISYQKCLIPKNKFPRNARPGQWAKCYFKDLYSNGQNYAVSQIFPRDDLENVCYLDMCVTNNDCNTDQKFTLSKLLPLEKFQQTKRGYVTYNLNPKYFIDNSSLLTKSFLLGLAKTLVQKYHLTQGSLVTDSYLQNIGVDGIRIDIENCSDDSIYCLTYETKVDIKNISLSYSILNRDIISLNVKPYTRVSQKLDDLMKFVRLQRFQKRSLCMSLNALIVGPIGSGKTSLVEEFLRRQRCNVFSIEITNCLKQYPGETEAELRKIFKAACQFENKFNAEDPIIILLEDIHLLCPQYNSVTGNNSETLGNSMRISAQLLSLVDELFASRSNIMCLATTSQPDSLNKLARRAGRFENEIVILDLLEEHRSDILKQLLQQSIPNFSISAAILETMAKQTQGYVIADLALLVRNVAKILLTKNEKNFELLILDILKKTKPISLKGSDVTTYKTTETFDSIGGMSHLKRALEVSVLSGLRHQESFKRFGLNLPKGVLLYGPPGCAKTTIAKCLATEANMTFISTSGAEVYSPYVGCAEKFIGKIFQTARKNTPCLIFLDEIDSLVGRRSVAGSSNSGEVQVRIISTLLTEMDGIITSSGQTAHILVVAATNRPDMIDDALLRPGRFDKLIHVPAPDLLSRRSILDLYKSKMPFSEFIDLDAIAVLTENYSGADICNLCNEAAMQAFQRDFNTDEIVMADFEHVLKTMKSSLVKRQIRWYDQFENKF